MKVVHVIKRMETIEEDIKDLRKLEKSLNRDKSFSDAIYMSIEKQINILLGDRIKLLELRIENPPEQLVEAIEGKPDEATDKKQQRSKKRKKDAASAKKSILMSDDDFPMLTQDEIDKKISSITISRDASRAKEENKKAAGPEAAGDDGDDEGVKLLDTALEHGTLNRETIQKTKDRKIKFFRENFPGD